LYDVIRASCSKHLGKPLELLVKKLLTDGESQIEMKHVGRLNFGNFMEPDANPKIYDEVIKTIDLIKQVATYFATCLAG
jgi:dynein heavy chain, axonemal